MELVSFDDETVTIRMNRRKEFGPISSVISAAAIDPGALDRELIMLSADELSQLEDSIRAVDERAYGRARSL